MNKEAQLQWEARWARRAALAAFAAAVALVAQIVISLPLQEDRPGIESGPDSLLSVDERPAQLLGSALVLAAGILLLLPVFLYLFRATIHRGAAIPKWFVYLVYIGPVLYALAVVLNSLDQIDLAHNFADRSYSFPNADPQDDPDLTQCPAINGELGEACAEELARDSTNVLALGLSLAGRLAVAFLFVMLPLRARRVGLLSPFMSILGVIAGALLVLPIVPFGIIQAFWLGGIGVLYLGNWPGGRGPAWDSGESEPWPSAAQKRRPPEGGPPEPAPEPEREPAAPGEGDGDPARERPASRKRKRKRT